MFSHSSPRKQLHMTSRATQRSALSPSVSTALPLSVLSDDVVFNKKYNIWPLAGKRSYVIKSLKKNTVWLQSHYTYRKALIYAVVSLATFIVSSMSSVAT